MTFHPQTPQSPCHFSPATSVDAMTTNLAASSAAAAGTGTTALPTPAHSVNGCSSQPDVALTDESPHKRKRALDDVGDRDQKKMHLEDRKLGIEDLHLDVGEKYLLCQTLHPESLPRTSEDLYAMYGLNSLATEVAREKPNGEKNALRKTYKGHIKRLGVAGHFDVQKKKDGEPSDFLAMLQVPDLEWNVHQVKGRDISDGFSQATLSALGRAMTMAKGPIPKGVWDCSVLGDLAPGNGDASKPVSAKPTTPNTPLTSVPPIAAGRPKSTAPVGSQDLLRPRRNIKKRSYGDASYEGYQEGFPDEEQGYSTGEGESGQKRRKKNTGNTPPYPAMRQQSYGPGMVGA